MTWRRSLPVTALAAVLLLSGCGAAADGANVTGLPKPASVKILVPSSELFVGQSIQLTATAQDETGADLAAGDPTWTSSNPGVAAITETGLVTAMAPGNVTLQATIAGKTASMGVLVENLPSYDVTVNVSASFAPASVTVRQFGTVHFVFSGIQQNVTFATAFPGAPADIPNTTTGTVNRQFGTVGDFRYESTVSAGLAGMVRVR